MSAVFGDIDVDDAYAASGVAAPEQVGNRLHEYRVELAALTGEIVQRYHQLSPDARALVDALGQALIELLHRSHDPELAAASFHEVRRFLAGPDVVPAWDDLPPDDRQLAVELLTLIVEWLEREGDAT